MTLPTDQQSSADKNRTNVNRGALIVALLALLLPALGFLGVGVYGIILTRQAQGWPTVSGEVFRSQVGAVRGESGEQYAPDVAYRYQVAGTEFQGTQLGLSPWTSTTSNRAQIVSEVGRYPVGKSVTVHYDPSRPAYSALEVPTSAPAWPLALGTGLLLPFMLLLWLWRRGSLNTLIRTGAVGRHIEYTPKTGAQITDYDGNTPGIYPPAGSASTGSFTGGTAEFTFNSNTPAEKGFNPARLAPLFLAIVFAVIGGVLWVVSAREQNAVQNAQHSWQSVTGRVVSSEVLAPDANLYRPSVTYEYEVAGRPYRSDRFALGDDTFRTNNRAQVAEEVARYVSGEPVTVYYNPASPSDAVLELRSRSSGTVRLLAMVFGGVAALCLLLLPVFLRR